MSHKLMGILSRKMMVALVCLLLVGGFATAAFAYSQTNAASANPPTICPKTVGYGSTGADVKLLQHKLNEHHYHLAVDGIFGSQTKAAVIAYQKAHHLGVDGVAGPQTWSSLGYCTPHPLRR